MVLLGGLGRSRAATLIVTIACGCEVHGFIGSNASAGSADEGSAESTGVSSADDGSTGHGSADESADTQGDDADVDESEDGADTSGIRFDLGQPDAPHGCEQPHALPSCDSQSNDPARALGLNCGANEGPGTYVDLDFAGFEDAMTVHSGQPGTSTAYLPREGDKFIVLSTGRAIDFTMSPLQLKTEYPETCQTNDACPSTEFMDPDIDTPMFVLPEPMDVRPVSDAGDTCWEDPGLVGTGDCSNTLWSPWVKGGRAFDYAELRMTATVPDGMNGFSFDFAFFSIEYPLYAEHPQSINDVYLTWLESERWTGNISFDESGDPITVKSVFFDYKDAPDLGDKGCGGPCNAPQLHGFAAQDHGGTKWLTSSAPVRSGEEITVVFAMFDNMDASFDSMTILDHFEWNCSGAPPVTTPAG